MALKISHACGHAKVTPGKQSPDGRKEWEQTDPICRVVMGMLTLCEGVEQKRFDDPTGKRDIPLKERYNAINKWGAHVHIDYHLNAHGDGKEWTTGNGVEVFVAESKPKEALALATKMQENLVAGTGFRNRGVKFKNWDMIYFTDMTAVLAELGFMTHKENTAFIRSVDGQKKIAEAIVKSLVQHYGLKKKPSPKPPQEPSKPNYSGLYKVQLGAFKDYENAERLRDTAIKAGFNAAIIKD